MTSPVPSAVSIGNFDGVHRGHLALVAALVASAKRLDARSVALTFEPHPLTVFQGVVPSAFRLTTDAERERLLRTAGADSVERIAFSREVAELDAEEFVRTRIVESLSARHVVVGHDFRFGRGRQGDAETLRRLGSAFGFSVEEVAPVLDRTEPVSSTRIRDAVRAGRLDDAAIGLGRSYAITGRSGAGAGRGTAIGIPTVNLYPDAQLLPPNGVYVTRMHIVGRGFDAITNIGVRPTFRDASSILSVETMALEPIDFDAHGLDVRVELIARIREERVFAGPLELARQIELDVAEARAIHGARSPE